MVQPELLLIKKLHSLEKAGFTESQISSQNFILEPDRDDIRKLWEQVRKKHKEKWHQFVRFIFFDAAEKLELSQRIARLLFENRNSIKGVFEISRESDNFQLPDRLSDFLRLRSLANEYREVYRSIMKRINFDYPVREYSDRKITGKINWHKTLQKSPFLFPIDFQIKTWNREFSTPENILLLLAAHWIKTDVQKILRLDLPEPLQLDEKKILFDLLESVNQLLVRFPFSDVINSLRKFAYERKNSEKIDSLLLETRKRIRDGLVRNPQYKGLVEWFLQYRELDFEVSVKNQKKYVIRNIEDIDSLYEIFIFLEFFNYLKNIKKVNPILERYSSAKYKITFDIDSKTIEFFHGKGYTISSEKAWALNATPDYSVELNDNVIAVFDAKNYSLKIDESASKNLAAIIDLKNMSNRLDRFTSKYPKFSNALISKYLELLELNPDDAEEFRKKKEEEFRYANEKNKKEKEKITEGKHDPKQQILSYMANLDVKYGGLIFPKFPEEQRYISNLKKVPEFVKDLKLETFRMDYNPKEIKKTREKTLVDMYDVIHEIVNESS